MNRRSATIRRPLVKHAESVWTQTAVRMAAQLELNAAEAAARRVTQAAVFLTLGRQRGLLSDNALSQFVRDGGQPVAPFAAHQGPLAPALWPSQPGPENNQTSLLADALHALAGSTELSSTECLGAVHQRLLDLRLESDGHGAWRRCVARNRRKATGTFYTPPWLAEYMAQNVLADPHPAWPTILDPACGGGSFLIAAWRCLAARPSIAMDPSHALQTLFGVDVDGEAVLLARRALWLEATSAHRPPDPRWAEILGQNIRCANLLLDGPAPDWPACFGVILGNPPYRRELGAKALLDRLAATDLGRQYRSPRMDLSYYFLHRALELLASGGRLAFVLGAYWTSGRGAAKLIESLRTEAQVQEIVCLDRARVFPGVSGRHLILTLRKGRGRALTCIKRIASADHPRRNEPLTCQGLQSLSGFHKPAEQLFRQGHLDLEPPDDALLAQVERWPPLSALAAVRQGIVENPASVTRAASQRWGLPAGQGVFALTAAEVAALDLPQGERDLLRPYHDLCDLGRYWLAARPSRSLIYSTAQTWPRFDQFPCLGAHLQRFRPIMQARRETRSGHRPWWCLHWPRDELLWQTAKLVSLQMGPRPAFVPACGPLYVPFSVNVIVPLTQTQEDLLYLAGLLNSRLLWTWFRHRAKHRGVGLDINGHVLLRAPIRTIDFAQPEQRRAHDEVVRLVRLRMACAPASGPGRAVAEEDSASQLEAELDRLVCRLYGLPDDAAGLP